MGVDKALVETHRRGVETAVQMAAVADGSEWIQTFFDFHRRDAIRILDFPHASEHISQAGQSVLGEGTAAIQAWLAKQLHTLKHVGPRAVLNEIRQLAEAHPTQAALKEHLAYLEKRETHMQYPTFRAEGWPIASGSTESGNKLVVEARLKGSGMHWARLHVDPMLALRNIVCNDRWDEEWPRIALALRQQDQQRRSKRRQQRRAQCEAMSQPIEDTALAIPAPQPLATVAALPEPVKQDQLACEPVQVKPARPRRPSANHPWRRMSIGRTRANPKT